MLSLLLPVSAGRFRSALTVLFAVLLVAACQTAERAGPVATNQVDLPRSYKFEPDDIKVAVGTTVTWTNNDNFTHTVRLLDSGEDQMLRPGETVTHAFSQAGLFRYDCSLHPQDMTGSVLVEAVPE